MAEFTEKYQRSHDSKLESQESGVLYTIMNVVEDFNLLELGSYNVIRGMRRQRSF